MKKAFALILAIVMAFSLFACGTTSGSDETASPSAPADTAPASTEPSTAPEPSASAAPADTSRIGYYDDSVDWFARDPYKICYMAIGMSDPIHASMAQAFEDWSKLLNVDYVPYDANYSYDTFITTLENYATLDYDGFILDIDGQGQPRAMDICNEYDLEWLPCLTAFTGEDGLLTHPAALLKSYDNGVVQATWLFENYKKYLGEIDPSEIGFMTIEFSAQPDIHARAVGAGDYYKENYPDLFETNYFNMDLINANFNAESAYAAASATISANADIKYWVIAGSNDDFAQGAARAAEALRPGKAIIISVMGDIVIKDWKTGYEGNWVACANTSQAVFCEPIICGLIAMLDGRATPETLWADNVPEGEKYGVVRIGMDVYTIENYEEFTGPVAEYVAAQYPDLKQLP